MKRNPETPCKMIVVRILAMSINEPTPARLGDHDPIAEMRGIIEDSNTPPPPTVEWTST